MTRSKKQAKHVAKAKRLHLHPCHLQGMHGDGFVRIANQVLRGQLTLLSFSDRWAKETATGAAAN